MVYCAPHPSLLINWLCWVRRAPLGPSFASGCGFNRHPFGVPVRRYNDSSKGHKRGNGYPIKVGSINYEF